jgi:predicted metal-dependent hydrolase
MVEERTVRLSDGEELPYTLLRRRGMKPSYIRIRDGGLVEVRCPPHLSLKTGESLLRQKERWLRKHRTASRERDKESSDWRRHFLYRGERYPVEHLEDPGAGKVMTLHLDREAKRATIRSAFVPEAADCWELYNVQYRLDAPRILGPRVERWSQATGLRPTALSFRRNRSLWGSCSGRNRISLNTRLLLLPDPLIDYIIVHELCHIRHKNHSREFWNLVERFLPDWKERRKALRNYENYLK